MDVPIAAEVPPLPPVAAPQGGAVAWTHCHPTRGGRQGREEAAPVAAARTNPVAAGIALRSPGWPPGPCRRGVRGPAPLGCRATFPLRQGWDHWGVAYRRSSLLASPPVSEPAASTPSMGVSTPPPPVCSSSFWGGGYLGCPTHHVFCTCIMPGTSHIFLEEPRYRGSHGFP